MLISAEYIWLDGLKPAQGLRSKTLVLSLNSNFNAADLPEWAFDGTTIGQENSDLILTPIHYAIDPIRGGKNLLVLCEVLNPDGSAHISNNRDRLVTLVKDSNIGLRLSFEQEYILYNKNEKDIEMPLKAYQGVSDYCAIGYGRKLAENHLQSCIKSGIGVNSFCSRAMPGQWAFKIGDTYNPDSNPVNIADQLWLSRWILDRLAEANNMVASIEQKPCAPTAFGSGLYVGLATNASMDDKKGTDNIKYLIERLSKTHNDYIPICGDGVRYRLTGNYGMSHIDAFGETSIRVPGLVKELGCGWIEDCRPGANADPYLIAAKLLDILNETKSDVPTEG